jgi:hypothetical protein
MNTIIDEKPINWLYLSQCDNNDPSSNVAFIYNHSNVYISDNHKIAFWAWMQECDLKSDYQFIHIDYHDDLAVYNEEYKAFIYREKLQNIHEYINLQAIKWDTYINLAHKLFPNWFVNTIFMTKGCPYDNVFSECSSKCVNKSCKNYNDGKGLQICYVCQGLEEIKTYVQEDLPIILNIDIDWFVDCESNERNYSEDEVVAFSENLSQFINSHNIAVCTIALSPEVCAHWDKQAGWNKAIRILTIMSKHVSSVIPVNFVEELSNFISPKE